MKSDGKPPGSVRNMMFGGVRTLSHALAAPPVAKVNSSRAGVSVRVPRTPSEYGIRSGQRTPTSAGPAEFVGGDEVDYQPTCVDAHPNRQAKLAATGREERWRPYLVCR
jgi:hypothetical protein